MAMLIEYLAQFNRKERFALIGCVLGNATFELGDAFRQELGEAVGVTIPRNAFVGMDYHLDWIYASVFLQARKGHGGPHPNSEKIIRAQQEDIDLIVAFHEAEIDHIILLEAKGATGWNNKQMTSKARRFREIFGEDGTMWPGVLPHFVIASPRRPERLHIADWPTWMAPNGTIPWLALPMTAGLRRVTRTHANGMSSESGEYWRVVPA